MSGSLRAHVRVVAAEIESGGRFLIVQRRKEARLPLLWEFPGGRVLAGETDGEALARTIRARIGIGIEVNELSLQVSHTYDTYTLDLLVYKCRVVEGEPTAVHVNDVRWVPPEAFGDYEFPGADQQTIDALLSDEST